ncbi:MAG: rhomboid family intramembrane serine protease [Oscillospiraceae bacterium]|nr:rhomboid family intramembrane serine protease [Oscillospiraceae bacterium]
MKNLRTRFERFCFRNRNKGIPNLMLYLSLGSALVYLMSLFADTSILYYWLIFDRGLILKGQLWRLISYPLTYSAGSLLMTAISLLCYYSLGRAMENLWGTLRFNLFYLSGVVMMDIYCMVFGGQADVYYLNLSLFLAYATLYPDSHFLLFFIIPVKAWIFALLDLALVLVGLFTYPFPANLFSVISLANYFLFFGKDVLNVIPMSWRANARRLFRKKPKQQKSKTVPFPNAGSYEASTARPKEPYTHRCTVCGRTDISNPELEFRYCSRCKGYYCYCQDHINNHSHIE